MRIQNKFNHLPVSAIADDVNTSLDTHPRLVVTAPPGAGKSTLLPLSILECLSEGKILMLEPRRIAARQVAERMASMLGEDIGATVGYRVRFDTKVSKATRIEVITEGILERMLIDDPTLEDVAAVIFDEFHERGLSSDLTLALTREIQNVIRPDLKILVMSATIDGVALAKKLDARYLHSQGKCYDVKIVYGEDFNFHECAKSVANAVRKALREHDGNILAFLPGQAEILKCSDMLGETIENVEIQTLYGMLSHEKQQIVMSSIAGGKRRVVLASPIAETSLTIDGISVVIDSGLYKTPVFEPLTGMSRLATVRISMDMAEQRTGRAGRQMPGICYRLWTKATESRMKECRQPEIESSDLSSMLLITSAWGETDPKRLPWITPPPSGHISNARNILDVLGATDDSGRLTEKGKLIAQLPCNPRIASMLTEAGAMKAAACDVAALLEERDPYQDETDADLSSRIMMLHEYRKGNMPPQWKKIDSISAQYRRLVKVSQVAFIPTSEDIGSLVAMAYPERICMRDENGKYRLAAGAGPVSLHPSDDLARNEFLAVASMGSRIFLAAPLDRDFVMSKGKWSECALWNNREGKVVIREELRLGCLVLAARSAKGDVRGAITAVIADAASKEGLTMFDFNDVVRGLQLRITVAASWHPELELPDVSTKSVLASAAEWLPMYIGNASTVQELRKINMQDVILGLLNYEQQQALDRIVPENLKLPSGRNVRIHYRRGAEAPVVSVRLQECFGMMKTPTVDEGRRQVLMELLSPGFKPVQLTQDMEGFWRETYFEVRKELRRRYPKHSWPENPI